MMIKQNKQMPFTCITAYRTELNMQQSKIKTAIVKTKTIGRTGILFKLLPFTFILTLLQFSSAFAQQLRLSLEKTVEIAADSSLQAFSARNVYQASYWEFQSFRAARLPSLTLQTTPLQYYRDITRRYNSETNMDVYRTQQSLYSTANMSIRQNLDLTGGTFFIDTDLGYIRNFGDQVYSQFTSVPIRVGYRQELFGFNSFKWEKRIEPLKYNKALRKFIYDREEISEKSAEYFFDLAMAQTEYEMATENVASADTLYRIGEERQKIAAISQADLLTLKLDAVNAKNTMKNAEINLKRAAFAFASYLNLDKETDVRIILPERPAEMEIALDEAIAHAKDNNPELLGNKQEILQGEREVERTAKSSVFDASFSISVGFNQVANSLADVYRKPLQQDVISVTFSIPLVDWGVRKGKLNMARNNLNVTRISVSQKELSLEQNVIMTVNDFNIQQNLIQSAEEALSLANMAYDNTRERFIIGKADINSLTLSLNRQKEARKNFISALKNYWLSFYKIRKLTLYDFALRRELSINN
ncbi:MAG: TolC family protein [Tannerellaceae bacterium]|nr:TolC family protein [Tannerellaceae bacterium]